MASVKADAQAATARAKEAEVDSDIIELINSPPQDVPDEALAKKLMMVFQSKKLRGTCTQLGLKPQADSSTNSKEGYIKLLLQYRRTKLRGEISTAYPKIKQRRPARTKHCGFKLVNVILSPALLPRMIEAGTVQSTGTDKYWQDVAEAYASTDPTYSRIVGFPERYEGIDPALAQQNTPAQLCAIWRDLTARYEGSYTRWKQLGTERAGFAHFCGDLAVQYLYDRLHMQSFPMGTQPEQERVPKRPRLEMVSDSARGNVPNSRNVQEPAELRVSNANGAQDRQNNQSSVQTTQLRASSTREDDFHLRQSLPQAAPVSAWMPRENVRIPDERPRQTLDPGTYRRENRYEGVIQSSQAVRDTTAAIDALKRGGFDPVVIAQAKESLDTIVQIWLRELDKAAQP
ncbi:hypothetical protein P3T76_001888 [Phytophthora citrophthora]|uniref:Uncharacterized protein n=1 Tax=Phytophthora citrophthora TaxID=4793 RepID=A0AAD9GXH5_9STRA|nr:hypothetical protein P3T76_001888 [Phytophthora citrophthora]